MSEDFKAGSLLFKRIDVLNEAMILYWSEVEPAFFNGLSETVEEFVKQNGEWFGEFNPEDQDIWLTLKEWNRQSEQDNGHDAWFFIDTLNESDYWVASFCNKGIESAQSGFRFTVSHKNIGTTKRKWSSYATSLSELNSKLNELGFIDLGNGDYFLPVTFDCNELSSSYEKFGKFERDDAFKPLLDALENIKQSAPTFTQMISGYTKNEQQSGENENAKESVIPG